MASAPLEIEVELDLVGTPVQGPAGPRGPAGPAGTNGTDGVDGINGINGLDGRDGANGVDGRDGVDGHDGIDGDDGLDGKSAYELWLEQGNSGTVMDFLAALVGEQGEQGPEGPASTVPGPKGDAGTQGIQGPAGPAGDDGQDGTDGADGLSAYQVAVANGFVGTEAQWLASLKGAKGDTGTQGIQGVKGDKGDKGEAGTGLTNRGNWVTGTTYHEGDYVFAAGTTADSSMWILNGTADYVSNTQPNTDLTHWIEFEAPAGADGADGTDGTNGREVELSNDGTNIRWRYVGETTWNVLISVAAITGPQGTAGAKGDKGDTGNAGAAGTNGKTLLSGTVIPTGATGTDGDFYLNLTTNLFYGPKASGAWPAGFSIVGPKGDTGNAGTAGTNGTNGNTVLTVSGTPAAGTGANGDYAYDPATWTFYGPKAAGAWPAGVVLKGTNGTAGKGVSSAVVTYQAHTSGTTAPTGTWNASVPTVTKGQYLWTRTVTTYTDSTTSTAYSVAYQGLDGTGGGGTVMGASGSGHASGLTPDTPATAGTTKFLREDATWAVPAGGGGGSSSLYGLMTADTNNPETTVAQMMSVNVAAATVYRVLINLRTRPSNTADGFKVGLTGTMGEAFMAMKARYRISGGTAWESSWFAKGTVLSIPSSENGNDGNLLEVAGILHVASAGTFGVGLAMAVQYAYLAVTKGSFMICEPIGSLSS